MSARRRAVHYCRTDGQTPAHPHGLFADADVRHDASDTTCRVCLDWMGARRAS